MDPLVLASNIGNISAIALFLSPLPTILRFNVKKSTEEFHPYNYLAGIFCSGWIAGYFPTNIYPNTLVWPINFMGVVLYCIYFYSFLCNTTKAWVSRLTAEIFGFLFLFFAVVTAISFVCYSFDKSAVGELLNIICILFNIGLYASPLTVVLNVFKAKSVKFKLPFWVGLAGFVNAVIWTTYALMLPAVDVRLLVAHGFGVVLSAFQLLLHAVYGHPLDCFLEPFRMVSRKGREMMLRRDSRWKIYSIL